MDITAVLILALVCFGMGILAGMLINSLRAGKETETPAGTPRSKKVDPTTFRREVAGGAVQPAEPMDVEERKGLSLSGVLSHAERGKSQVETTPTSIVAQIDEILQEQMEGTDLANKGVRLMELPGKGMYVMVGLEKYASVDEVPDEQIRAAIRYAVAEWEERVSGASESGG